jgi:hypothetical protein
MATRRTARSKNVIEVDGSEMNKEGGGSVHIPEGDYLFECVKAEQATSKNDNDMVVWELVGKEGKAKGKKFWVYTVITPEALWKLGQVVRALQPDIEVPDEPFKLDLDEFVGCECMGVVEDDEYDGKVNSKIRECFAVGDDGGKEAPAAKGKTAKGNSKTKIEASEVQAMAEDELADLIKEHDLDVDLKEHKTLRRKASAVIDALEEGKLLA